MGWWDLMEMCGHKVLFSARLLWIDRKAKGQLLYNVLDFLLFLAQK